VRDAPCRTHEIPLGQAVGLDELTRIEGVPERAYAQLAGRYGHLAHEVLRIAQERGELSQPVVDGPGCPPDLLAEVVHAARHEQARTVGDALLRRTRLGLTAARDIAASDGAVARRVAAAMAPELGWTPARTEAEAQAFLVEAAREGIVAG